MRRQDFPCESKEIKSSSLTNGAECLKGFSRMILELCKAELKETKRKIKE